MKYLIYHFQNFKYYTTWHCAAKKHDFQSPEHTVQTFNFHGKFWLDFSILKFDIFIL